MPIYKLFFIPIAFPDDLVFQENPNLSTTHLRHATLEQAENLGTKIKTSEDLKEILECLISDLNNDRYTTDENYFVVFKDDKIFIS